LRKEIEVNPERPRIDTIDQYIEEFPEDIQRKLSEMRSAIRRAAPEASEKISYQMPAFHFNGILVYFAAYRHHIGFYPTPSAIMYFQNDLKEYKSSKGAVQFPHDKPLPLALIKRIVRFRVEENGNRKGKSRG
jgi:uncharacterized protein YdhG (YjbR/CyaY superfamily)